MKSYRSAGKIAYSTKSTSGVQLNLEGEIALLLQEFSALFQPDDPSLYIFFGIRDVAGKVLYPLWHLVRSKNGKDSAEYCGPPKVSPNLLRHLSILYGAWTFRVSSGRKMVDYHAHLTRPTT